MLDFLTFALTGIFAGWLWCAPEAHLLDPIRQPFIGWVSRRAESSRRSDRFGWAWVLRWITCPVCVGTDVVLALEVIEGWNGWVSVRRVAAAGAVHVLWMSWLKTNKG